MLTEHTDGHLHYFFSRSLSITVLSIRYIRSDILSNIYTGIYDEPHKKIIRKEISCSVNILNAVFKENENYELLGQAGGVRGEDQRDVRREPGRRVPRSRQCCQEINKELEL